MRKIFLSTLLVFSFAVLPFSASAKEIPQWINDFGMSFRLIPPGKGIMGRDGWAGVSPRRTVTISREFGMGVTEVTQGQWKAVMSGKTPSKPPLGDDLPVTNVSWNDVQIFLTRLNALDAPRRYRLPTSAEWEYAARAGSHATWITGDGTPAFPESLREYAWFMPDRSPHPVAQKKPNDWGLYDMSGNVREWVQDYWQHDYYASMPEIDPQGPASGKMRVWRDGCYEDSLEACSFVSRDADKPSARNKRTGFRVVLDGASFRSALTPTEENSAVALPAGTDAYAPILENLRNILTKGLEGRDREDGEYGVMEAVQGREGSEALRSVGWLVRDLSGDGVPELVIGSVEQGEDGKFRGSQIYALYTLKNGKPHLTQEGTFRNAFALMDNGQFFHHGSGGAMYSIFGVFALTQDGTSLVCQDYWFTHEKNRTTWELGFYHNSSGQMDTAVSEEVSETTFMEQTEKLSQQRRDYEFSVFMP